MTSPDGSYITKLADIPNYKGWLREQIFAVVNAAPYLFTQPFSMSNMAVGVFDNPYRSGYPDSPNFPVDIQGTEAFNIMSPYLVGEFVGKDARFAVVDGLSPAEIRFIKAYSAARTKMSNREQIAITSQVGVGHTRSFGAVYVEVWLPGNSEAFTFVVATSGSTAAKDHQLSATIAERIVATAIEWGYLPPFSVNSSTFIIGADSQAVAEFAAANPTQAEIKEARQAEIDRRKALIAAEQAEEQDSPQFAGRKA
jgi:hypothetical protein